MEVQSGSVSATMGRSARSRRATCAKGAPSAVAACGGRTSPGSGLGSWWCAPWGAGPTRGAGAFWNCQCDCGKMVQVHAHKLKCGHTRSCGCAHQDGIRNLQGQRFGKRTVLEDSGQRRAGGGILWRCRCQCGQEKLIRQDAWWRAEPGAAAASPPAATRKSPGCSPKGALPLQRNTPLGICRGATASTLRCSARGSWPTSLRTTGFSIPPTAAGAGTRKPGFSAPRPAMG